MNNKKNKPRTIVLYITTYRIPITIVDGEVIELKDKQLSDDMIVKKERVEINPDKENLTLKIPEYCNKIAGYNKSQIMLTLSLKRGFINKQILRK